MLLRRPGVFELAHGQVALRIDEQGIRGAADGQLTVNGRVTVHLDHQCVGRIVRQLIAVLIVKGISPRIAR